MAIPEIAENLTPMALGVTSNHESHSYPNRPLQGAYLAHAPFSDWRMLSHLFALSVLPISFTLTHALLVLPLRWALLHERINAFAGIGCHHVAGHDFSAVGWVERSETHQSKALFTPHQQYPRNRRRFQFSKRL